METIKVIDKKIERESIKLFFSTTKGATVCHKLDFLMHCGIFNEILNEKYKRISSCELECEDATNLTFALNVNLYLNHKDYSLNNETEVSMLFFLITINKDILIDHAKYNELADINTCDWQDFDKTYSSIKEMVFEDYIDNVFLSCLSLYKKNYFN